MFLKSSCFLLLLICFSTASEVYIQLYTDLSQGGEHITTLTDIDDLTNSGYDNDIESFCGNGM